MNEQRADQREVSDNTTTIGGTMTNDQSQSNEGPLKFLHSPPYVATARVIQEKLLGYTSAANWIVEGLSDELDALRSEHLRVRDQVVAADQAVAELAARWRVEDAEYEDQLRQGHRDGKPDSIKDDRTPVDQREAEDAHALERYWAGVRVLGEKADAIRAYFGEHEPELMAELRSRVAPAQEKQRDAQRLLDEARTGLWRIAQVGQWVQKNRDAGPFAQPPPVPSPPPKQFSSEMLEQMLERALERPWHREPEEPLVAWQDQQSADNGDDPEPPDESGQPDTTGEVSELVDTGGEGTSS